MMQKNPLTWIFLLLLSVFLSAYGKDDDYKEIITKDAETNEYYYENIVEVPGISKEEMFKRAKEWIVSNLKTSYNNLIADEKELRIVNSGNLLMSSSIKGGGFHLVRGVINFKITMGFKEGKYKIRVDNIVIQTALDGGGVIVNETNAYGDLKEKKSFHSKFKRDANEKIQQLSSSLDNAIKSNSAERW